MNLRFHDGRKEKSFHINMMNFEYSNNNNLSTSVGSFPKDPHNPQGGRTAFFVPSSVHLLLCTTTRTTN